LSKRRKTSAEDGTYKGKERTLNRRLRLRRGKKRCLFYFSLNFFKEEGIHHDKGLHLKWEEFSTETGGSGK